MKSYTIKNEHYTVTVSEIGAEIISMKDKGGRELLWQSPSDEYWSDHAPVLFPVCGRLKNETYTVNGGEYHMKIHGFARRQRFTLVELTPNRIQLWITENEETLKQYPFAFKLIVLYELVGDTLKFSTYITNNTDTVMPYMFGWHPGFVLPTDGGQDIEDYRVEFDGVNKVDWYPILGGSAVSKVAFDYPLPESAYKLSEKEIYENDTMIFMGHGTSCRLYAPSHPFEMRMSWSDNLPLLCIWKEPFNETKFLCVEPWSNLICDSDKEDYDSYPGIPRLAPHATATYTYTVSIKN